MKRIIYVGWLHSRLQPSSFELFADWTQISSDQARRFSLTLGLGQLSSLLDDSFLNLWVSLHHNLFNYECSFAFLFCTGVLYLFLQLFVFISRFSVVVIMVSFKGPIQLWWQPSVLLMATYRTLVLYCHKILCCWLL